MITINTTRGVIELPCPPDDDAQTIMGNCAHGISLFKPCDECERIEEYQFWKRHADRFNRAFYEVYK